MKAQIYCDLRKTQIVATNLVSGTPIGYSDFRCGDAYLFDGKVCCFDTRKPCNPFEKLNAKIESMPRESQSELVEIAHCPPKFTDPCPVGSPEDVELGALHGA